MRSISILGSTGSVGSQALDVIRAYREEFYVVGLASKRASQALLEQTLEFKPKYVLTLEEPTKDWLSALPVGTQHLTVEEGLKQVIEESHYILNAVSGVDGLLPTYEALTSKDKILLASNKESIVCLPQLVKENRERIVPVDSEHNALFELLHMVDLRKGEVRRVYLTASGGPFRTKSLEELERVSVKDALNHPTWRMGSKITVDSATLMNKGIEILEALALFDIDLDTLDVVIHPQSVVHGIVELVDGSYLFNVSQPDMRIPILHALFCPERKPFPFETKSLLELSPISFEKVDNSKFPAISLCKWTAQMGGVYVPVLLGADETAVELFLQGKIKFTQIYKVVEEVLSSVNLRDPSNIQEIIQAIEWGRERALEVGRRLTS